MFLDKKGGKVWKFFMSGTAARVNQCIYKLLLENADYNEKYCIKEYKGLVVVITDYLGQGLQKKKCDILTFAGAVDMLGLMHKNNYIHGDVRAANIIIYADTN